MLDLLLSDVTDRDAQAWAVAVRGAGAVVSGAQVRRVARLIRGLKAGGVWSSLDRLWLFAAENSTQALTDLKARAVATANSSPVFTANRGYKGTAGRTAYIDSGFNPSTASGNYTQNAASFGVYVETADSDVSTLRRYVGDDESNYGELGVSTTTMNAGVNAAGPMSYAFVSQVGFWHARRTASNAQALFYNGASVATGADLSVALVNRNFNFLAGNNAGTAYQPTDGRLAVGFIAGNLNGKEAAFYNRIRTYLTAVGVA